MTRLALPQRVLRLGAGTDAVSAVEFALVLPILIIVIGSGFEVMQGALAAEKVTRTAHALADMTARYTTMGTSDMATVLGASSQVMAPFPTSSLTIVLTEYQSCVAGAATVTWSKAVNGSALAAGSAAQLPAGICPVGGSVIQATVTYAFVPSVLAQFVGSIPMSSTVYMVPRNTASVAYTGS